MVRAVTSASLYRVSPVSSPGTSTRSHSAPKYGFQTSQANSRLASKPAVKSDLKLHVSNIKSNHADPKIVIGCVITAVSCLFIMLLLNIYISSISLKAANTEYEISKLKQDTQTLRVQMEKKGTDIPNRAAGLGMVPRDKTIQLKIDEGKIAEQNAKVDTNQAAAISE